MGGKQSRKQISAEQAIDDWNDQLTEGLITSATALARVEAIREAVSGDKIPLEGDLADVLARIDALIGQLKIAIELDKESQEEKPDQVHTSFEGWATRCPDPVGNSTQEIFDGLVVRRHGGPGRKGRALPRGYRGACYTSTYVLKENLCGRPTDFAFGKESIPKEMGAADRTRRLGLPVLVHASTQDVVKFIGQQTPRRIFEIRGADNESGHAIIAISPGIYLDVENSGPPEQGLNIMLAMGKDRFTVWDAGTVAEQIPLDSPQWLG
ncbi:hypothetical protein ABZW32_19140 [Streptomyces sp. NPDC004667]|uniref:hypothetical protein n=1 Tax=Streptomyces sp. NPDC004667 TaxID=3154285 RepID=UPI0033ABD45E